MKDSYMKDLFEGDPLPDKLQIIISVNKDDDMITVSKCLNPEFDMQVLTEGLASLIMIASKYTEKNPLETLDIVHKKLKTAVLFHGKMEKPQS